MNGVIVHCLSPYHSTSLIVVTLASLCAIYIRSHLTWKARSRGRPLPPGPQPLPFIGNLLDMPHVRMWEGLKDLSMKYGDILRLRMFDQNVVILGSPEVIFELLEKRSANSSDRKQTPSIPLMGHDTTFELMSYGPTWKTHRRAFWQQFNPTSVTKYHTVLREMSHRFLTVMLKEPARLEKNLQDCIAATLLRTLYGFEARDSDHQTLSLVWDCVEGIRELLISGGFLMDFFPILRFAPSFVPFQRKLARWRAANMRFKNELFAQYKLNSKPQDCGGHPCIVGEVIESLSRENKDVASVEHIAQSITVDAVNAGTDTATTVLQVIFFAMSLYPSVQRKAQVELEAIVGPDRLPNFDDRKSLVYLDAIIKEALRWIPSTPLGLTHCTREDDELNGYFIPAGTALLANIWACLHDPTVYGDPETFRPERFLCDGEPNPDVRDPSAFAFGFGRRICPGRHFGLAVVFIYAASALHVFDFSPPLDEHGREIRIQPRMANGFVSRAEDARCLVKPRSARAEALILKHGT